MRKLALIALLTTVTPWACAQRLVSNVPHSAIPFHTAPIAQRSGSLISLPGPRAFRGPRSEPFGTLFYPFGGFGDFSYEDALSATGYPVAAQPQVIMMQPADPGDNRRDRLEPPSNQALLIELQGDQYIRVSDRELGARDQLYQEPAPPSVAASSSKPRSSKNIQPVAAPVNPPHDLPPATLVYRDGHSEQVRDYSIANGIIYARGDYYTDGYWTRNVLLSDLNLPETMKSNEARGVRFVLPGSPNEVVTRP